MPTKKTYIKNIIPGKKTEIVVYATPRLSAAIKDVTEDMTFYKGVKLQEILEYVYNQGKKDGAREVFDVMEKRFREAQKAIPHKLPGRPKKSKHRRCCEYLIP